MEYIKLAVAGLKSILKTISLLLLGLALTFFLIHHIGRVIESATHYVTAYNGSCLKQTQSYFNCKDKTYHTKRQFYVNVERQIVVEKELYPRFEACKVFDVHNWQCRSDENRYSYYMKDGDYNADYGFPEGFDITNTVSVSSFVYWKNTLASWFGY